MPKKSPRGKTTRRSKTAPLSVRVALRRQYVLSLRRTGATYDVIFHATRRRFSNELPQSYNVRDVHRDVTIELGKLDTDMGESAQEIRLLETQRLDQMLAAIWERAIGMPGNSQHGGAPGPADLEAQKQVLAIMARREKYIPGLIVPTRIAPTTPDGEAPYDPQAALHDLEATFARLAQASFAPNTEPPHDDTPETHGEPGAAMGAPLP